VKGEVDNSMGADKTGRMIKVKGLPEDAILGGKRVDRGFREGEKRKTGP